MYGSSMYGGGYGGGMGGMLLAANYMGAMHGENLNF